MTEPSRATDFFTAGGTLRLDSPSYVKRPADDELFNLALAGEFCHVLTPRQMGKSSLMVRTFKRLQEHGIRTAIIDLTEIGTVTVDQWYLGLMTRIKRQLNLTADLDTLWKEWASLGPVQRFTDFLRDVVLQETEGSVVIFIDEIDSTLNLHFSDDFFAAIRAMHNARASDPELNRLTFVLLGVATPADLIKDRARSPFNIGQGIALQEFSYADAQVLEQGVEAAHPGQGKDIFARIFYWTNGHPYLTQKLCLEVAKRGDGTWTFEKVDRLVEELFLSEEARRETNLRSVQDSIQASRQRRKLLGLYRKVYEGREIADDERSRDQNWLKLFGLVQAERGLLRVRNQIYRRVFDLNWIKTNTPVDWTRRIAVISTILVLVLGGLFGYYRTYIQPQQTTEARAQVFIDNFRGTTSADVRITSLAGLFELSGYEDRARQLFYEKLRPDEQRALFERADPQAVGTQLVTVVKGLYTELENTDRDSQLLEAMAQPLRELDDPTAVNLATEIELWVTGRRAYDAGKYQQAVDTYSVAISLNDGNPGTYFDRGLAYAAMGELRQAMGELRQALADFETVLSLDEDWQKRVRQAVVSDDQLYATLLSEGEAYHTLVALVPTPTNTSTPTSTPTVTSTSSPTHTPVIPTATPSFTPVPPAPTPIPPTATPMLTGIPTLTPKPPLTGKIAYGMSDGIYVMDADGSNRKRVYNKGDYWMPVLSPDGNKIAFIKRYIGPEEDGLWVKDVYGNGIQQIVSSGKISCVTWAPDSNWIAYTDSGAGYIVEITGGEPEHVGGQYIQHLAWSPDGAWFAYQSSGQGLVKRSVSGGPEFVLDSSTDYLGGEGEPAWSPDGTRIAYSKGGDIWVINADGSGQTNLTKDPALDGHPCWSPDGSKIVFHTNRDGNYEIYVMNADGSSPMNLTNSADNEWQPTWALYTTATSPTPTPEVEYDPGSRTITIHPGDAQAQIGRLCKGKMADVGRNAVFLRAAYLQTFGEPAGLLATVSHVYPEKGINVTLPNVEVGQYNDTEIDAGGEPLDYRYCAFSADQSMRSKLGLPLELERFNDPPRFDHGTIIIQLSSTPVGFVSKDKPVEPGIFAASDQANLASRAETFRQFYWVTAAINGTAFSPGSADDTSYRLSYDRVDGDHYSVWETVLPETDVSSLSKLAFDIRGQSGGEIPNVWLTSPSSPEDIRNLVDIEDYVMVSTDWQRVEIPLTDFHVTGGSQQTVDLTRIIRVQIAFEWEDMAGMVYVDGFAFEP